MVVYGWFPRTIEYASTSKKVHKLEKPVEETNQKEYTNQNKENQERSMYENQEMETVAILL